MSALHNNKAFLAIGGTAAGAGIASAIAGLIVPAVPLVVPIVGALATALALKFLGVLDNPERVLFDPKKGLSGSEK